MSDTEPAAPFAWSVDRYLVWSNKHSAWWAPGHTGYTRSISQAGRYTHHEAMRICQRALPGTADRLGHPPEIPVREADAAHLAQTYLYGPEPWM